MNGTIEHEPSWDQRDGETAKSFSAFETFKSLPPTSRTVLEAYRQRMRKRNAKACPPHWYKWKQTHDWTRRANAWDRHLYELDRSRAEDEEIQRRAEIRSARVAGYAQMLAVGTGGLDRFLDDDGNPVEDEVNGIQPVTSGRLIRDGARGLAEEYDELPTQRHEHAGDKEKPVSLDFSSMDPSTAARIYREAVRDPDKSGGKPKK